MPQSRTIAVTLLVGGCLAVNAAGDEYKEATVAAYCAGVIQRSIEITKKLPPPVSPTSYRGNEQHLAGLVAFVQGAIKQKQIAPRTVSRLMAIGQSDEQLCDDVTWKCWTEAIERNEQNMDADANDRMQEKCVRPVETVCKRVEACF
jgi:hypothetical protein